MTGNSIMRYLRIECILLALLCFLPLSCDSVDDQSQIRVDKPAFLPLDGDVVVHPLGDEIGIAYTSLDSWELSFSDTWVTSSSMKGDAGTSNVTFTANPNVDPNNGDRSCTVKFMKGGKTLDSFVIHQSKAKIDLSQDRYDLGWSGANSLLTVESNIQWVITRNNDADYEYDFELNEIKGSISSGNRQFQTTSSEINFWPKKNNLDVSPKNTIITITPYKKGLDGKPITLPQNVMDNLKRTVSVSQDFLIFMVNDSRDEVKLGVFSELGKEYVDTVTADIGAHSCDTSFTLTSELAWEELAYDEALLESIGATLTLEGERQDEFSGRTVNIFDLRLTMNRPNPSREMGEHVLKFWVRNDEDAFRDVSFYQSPYVFELQDAETGQRIYSLDFVNAGGEHHVKVNTTGPWKIDDSTIPEWLSFESLSGVGPTDIIARVADRNMTFNDLDKDVRLTTASLNPAVEEIIPAHQDEFVFKVIPDENLRGLSRVDENEYNVHIISSGPWELRLNDHESSYGADWLDVSILDDEDVYSSASACDTIITVRAREKNPDRNNDRQKNISVCSILHRDSGMDWGGHDHYDFDVVQERFRFEIQNSINDSSDFIPDDYPAYKSTLNTQSFYLRCSAPWKMDFDKNWITSTLTSGTGEYLRLTLRANTNTSREPRPAEVTIVADVNDDGVYGNEGDETRTMSLWQEGFVFNVSSLDASATNIPAITDMSFTIQVESTSEASWSVECDDWLMPDVKSGTGSGSVTFVPRDNGAGARLGTALIKSDVATQLAESRSFSQAAYEFNTDPYEQSEPFHEISAKNADRAEKVAVKCTNGGEWWIESIPSWLSVTMDGKAINSKTKYKGTGSNQYLSFTTKADNTSTTDLKNATVHVKSQVGGFSEYDKSISLSQSLYTFVVKGMTDLSLDALEEDAVSVEVTSSGEWYAGFTEDEKDDFVTVSISSGSGDRAKQSTRVTVKPNYWTESRSAVFEVKSKQSTSADHLRKTMSITQTAYEYNVSAILSDLVKNGLNFSAAENLEKAISGLRSTGKLIVEKPASATWLTVSLENGVLTIRANENKDTKANGPVEVTVRSEHSSKNPALITSFKVSQDAAEAEKKK